MTRKRKRIVTPTLLRGPACERCDRQEGDVLHDQHSSGPGSLWRLDKPSEVPLGAVTVCPECGRLSCPDCQCEGDCCVDL